MASSRGEFDASDLVAIDSEIGAVHAAQVAPAAFLRMNHVRRMIPLGIEGGRERKNFRRTEFHAKTASLAALHNNINLTFCHWYPPLRQYVTPKDCGDYDGESPKTL
jgi:hypothetical protein